MSNELDFSIIFNHAIRPVDHWTNYNRRISNLQQTRISLCYHRSDSVFGKRLRKIIKYSILNSTMGLLTITLASNNHAAQIRTTPSNLFPELYPVPIRQTLVQN